MSAGAIPLPKPPTLEQATRKYWLLWRLYREKAIDGQALRTALATLAPVIPSAARDLSRMRGSAQPNAPHPLQERP